MALLEGYLEGYFLLAEQFRTQDEPSYCGLATLTMVLNALGVDPARTWKGVWRWYAESLLDCCRSLEEVQRDGISFDELLCLADCHGLAVESWRPAVTRGWLGKQAVGRRLWCGEEKIRGKSINFLRIVAEEIVRNDLR